MLDEVFHDLLKFTEDVLSVGGHFNASLDPVLDTSFGKSAMSAEALKHFINFLQRL